MNRAMGYVKAAQHAVEAGISIYLAYKELSD
jgi:hypothetical protein